MGRLSNIMSPITIVLFVIGFSITILVLTNYVLNPADTENSINNVVLLLIAAGFLLSGILIAMLSLIKFLERVG